MKLPLALALAAILLSSLMACDSRETTGSSIAAHSDPLGSTRSSVQSSSQELVQTSSFTVALSEVILGLVQDTRLYPDRDAVDVFAKAFKWQPTKPEMNKLMNAKKGYIGKLEGIIVLLGSDGTNDIISLAVKEGFEQAILIEYLRKFVELKFVESNSSMGQQTDLYKIYDYAIPIGLLSITYGIAEPLRGSGTVGFISSRRAKAEGISQ